MHVSACVYPSLPTDVAETVYSVGAQDDHGWASLLHTYNISLSAAQKNKILFALTCSRDTNKLHRYVFSLLHHTVNAATMWQSWGIVSQHCCQQISNIYSVLIILNSFQWRLFKWWQIKWR